jgi:long-subunit fatty acid transport protein
VRRLGLAAVALATAATTVAAQEEGSLNRPGSGARAAGMGNAFIAVSDDGTAASWNPAGLSQLLKPEFSLVHSTSHRNRQLEGYQTRDESAVYTALATQSSTADIEFASAAVPFRLGGRPVTLQVGWRRLYQLATRVQGDTRRVAFSPTARPESTVRVDAITDGSINLWSLAGAIGVTNRLSVGWSLDFYRGQWEERTDFNEDPGILGPTDFVSSVQSDRIGGHALNLGLLLAYPSVSVGFVYHGPLRGDLSETFSLRSSLLEPIDGSSPPSAELRFPQSFGAGVAWRPRPLVRLALDVTYNEWTQFLVDETGGSTDDAVSGFDGLPPELSATRDTVSLNAGVEKLFPAKSVYVPLRLGVAYEPQGGRDDFLRDDFTYYILAAGTGVNTNSLKFDVALEYRWGSVRTSQNISLAYQVGRAAEFALPPPPEAQGTQRFQQWQLKVSVIYRITNTEKLTDFLKKVFGS